MLLLVNVCLIKMDTITYKDNSIPLKNNEQGYIDRNCYNDKYFAIMLEKVIISVKCVRYKDSYHGR
jgi:hypothetical protein